MLRAIHKRVNKVCPGRMRGSDIRNYGTPLEKRSRRHPASGEQVRSRGFRFGQARTRVRRDTRCGACATSMSIATAANSLASKASAMSARIWQRACSMLTRCPRPFRRGSAATDPAFVVRHLVSTIVPVARAVGGFIDRCLPQRPATAGFLGGAEPQDGRSERQRRHLTQKPRDSHPAERATQARHRKSSN